jgi:two-component system chemotaxis response regulator CheB
VPQEIRALVVDDSALARSVLTRYLTADPAIQVVGTAVDGVDAVEKTRSLRPDVVTLDIMMPRLDGLRALRCIMNEMPTPVVMVSVLSKEGADVTIQALALGAIDFVHKRMSFGEGEDGGMADELREKVRIAVTAQIILPLVNRKRAPWDGEPPADPGEEPASGRLVVIGASTGGPQALRTVIASLPERFAAPVLVVQHMPAQFTRSLAESLDRLTPLTVAEAARGMTAEPGGVLVAPGGLHMTIGPQGVIGVNRRPSECGVRPSLNIAMESAVRSFGGNVIGVVLTGMGSDGARGAGLIAAAGGDVLVQDPATAVVGGMPSAVLAAGYATEVAPLDMLAGRIARLARQPRRELVG